jgi:hypothetical protein
VKAFLKHPHAVGMTYWGHFCFASKVAIKMITAGTACMIHAVLPFLFQKTASKVVKELHSTFTRHHDGYSDGGGI